MKHAGTWKIQVFKVATPMLEYLASGNKRNTFTGVKMRKKEAILTTTYSVLNPNSFCHKLVVENMTKKKERKT
ncbi:hypothetical protein CEXT_396501 [Caerostris extrusa]|uniref:Uncharacterized protein n=1 Tax=Caerostris extrusa TaxID=172846 RepID=A0AAV4S9A0_CAEEX|nr:hypothetical protein CEXT_396501 [Caerostris extrusa]